VGLDFDAGGEYGSGVLVGVWHMFPPQKIGED